MKRLVFHLTKIPFLKCLISIYFLVVEVLNDQNLFTESNWLVIGFRVMSNFIKVQSGKVNHLNDQFESLWSNLDAEIISSNSLDGGAITEFIRNLKHQKSRKLLLGGLVLPFDQLINTLITRFVSCALGKSAKFAQVCYVN